MGGRGVHGLECRWEVGGSRDWNVSDTFSNKEAVVDLGMICIHGVIHAEARSQWTEGRGGVG